MIAIATVLIVMIVSLLIARVATVALVLTGLSPQAARFQARSALSGTGFTTSEAESVVNHPVRRRIVMTLMLIGSAGLVTVLATLMLSFANAGGREAVDRILLLLGGLVVVWLLAKSSWVDRRLSWLIAKVLNRWTDLEARDYGALLHLAENYGVAEIAVCEGDWLAERPLGELELRDEGVVVLGVTPAGGGWIGSPMFDQHFRPGDEIVAYGPTDRLRELDRRRAGEEGDRVHADAVARHRSLVAVADPQR
ncbi:MAG TPA: TrkA C-terminal domain-containing protein [Solirubrobacteraceae bacterium]|nr:TrkA C-terminal domain-containing protein [Solirubrobacteraceae bacterium]